MTNPQKSLFKPEKNMFHRLPIPFVLVCRANPIIFVNKNVPPFQIYHGELETSVPMGQCQSLADALKAVNADVVFEIIPDDGHGPKVHLCLSPSFWHF